MSTVRDDGLSRAPEDVARIVRDVWALRDAAQHADREHLAQHAEIPWLQRHIEWELVAVVGASHGLVEVPPDAYARLWPTALDEARTLEERPADVAENVRSLSASIGRAPCVVRPPDAESEAYLRSYFTLAPVPPGPDAIDARLAPYRTRLASLRAVTVVRCASGRPLVFAEERSDTTLRWLPVIVHERQPAVSHD